ncbi:AI-2E family transporter [Mycoplasmatota bacterium WC44]
MDKKIKRALYILIILGIIFMLNILFEPLTSTFRQIFSLLAPFIFGFAGAFILHPAVDFLVSKKINRLVAILITVFIILLIVVLFIGQLLPMILDQFSNIVNSAPELLSKMLDTTDGLLENFNLSLEELDIDWKSTLTTGLSSTYNIFVSLIYGIFNSLTFIFLTPILMIYFLFDYYRIREWIKNYLSSRKLYKIHDFLKELESLLSRYVGGLILIMILLSIISFIMFKVSGLDNALFFGFIIGLTNLIPIVGNIIGGIIAIIFALTQSTTLALIITIEVFALIIIESNFVTPFIQSKNVEIHPLLIILGITVFGYLFGFIGVLLAIPLIITVKLAIKYKL